MSISRVGSAKHATTPTVPTHAIGDLILGWAFRDGSTTPPSLPSGYYSLATVIGTSCSARLFCKIATATNDTMGASTNATETQCVVYRSTTGFCVPGYVATNAGTTNTLNYAALATMADVSGRSWVAGGVGHRSINQDIETAPSGMTLVDNLLDATAETALHDTNGAVSSWSSTNQTISGTASGWCSFALEICEAGPEAGDVTPVQVVSASNDASASSLSATGSAVGTGNCVVGFVWHEYAANQSVNTVTDNLGNSYTVANTYSDTTNKQRFTTFYKNGITGDPTTLTTNLSAAASFRGIMWLEFSGVDAASDPRDGVNGVWQNAPTTNRDAVNSGSVTTTQVDDALVAFLLNVWDNTAATPGSGYRLLGSNSSPGSCFAAAAMRIERGTRSVPGLWTAGSNVTHISALVTLKKSSSGSTAAGAGSAAATTTATGAGEAVKSAAGSAGASTTGIAGGARIASATGFATVTSSASAAGQATASASGAAGATGAGAGVGSATVSSSGAATGTSSAAAVGRSTASSAGSAAAVSAAAGSSSAGSIASGAGSASVGAVANGVGSSNASSAGSAAATTSVSGVGRATVSASGLAAANSNVAGAGRSTASSAGAAAASTMAAGVSSSAQGSTGSASVTSSAAAGSSSLASAAGSAAAGVTITGAGVSIVSRPASAAVTSIATASGRSIVAAAANANVVVDAAGVGRVVATGTGVAEATTAALARSTFNLSTQPAALIV